MKKQTAVDFLIEMTKPVNWSIESWKEHYVEVFAKAKAMEKEQIIETIIKSRLAHGKHILSLIHSEEKEDTLDYYAEAEQYYNETFKSE